MSEPLPGAERPADAICDHCGRCLSVCPVYRQSLVETDSPRGRVELTTAVAAGELIPGPRFAEIVDRCLLCRACTLACPKGVDTPSRVIRARADLLRSRGLTARLGGAVMDALIAHRDLMAAAVRLGGMIFKGLPADDTGRRHFPEYLPRMLAGRGVPPVSARPLRRILPVRVPRAAGSKNRGTAVFFSGCYYGLVDPGPAEAAVRLLSLNGFDVIIPPDQQCCGAPALFSGRLEGFRAAMRRNLRVLAALDGPVISACPTCASALRIDYPAEADRLGGPEADLARGLAGRVREAVTFLADLDHPVLPGREPAVNRVAIHQPCHFVHAGGDSQAPADLLKRRGVDVVLNGTGLCCGGGGVSSLNNPDLAAPLGRAVAKTMAASGAEAALAACPGCVLQIGSHLGRLGHAMPALHPLELLDGKESK